MDNKNELILKLSKANLEKSKLIKENEKLKVKLSNKNISKVETKKTFKKEEIFKNEEIEKKLEYNTNQNYVLYNENKNLKEKIFELENINEINLEEINILKKKLKKKKFVIMMMCL